MDDYLKLKKQVCFPIYTLSREIINHYRPFLDELDITYSQYLVLMVLWEDGLQTVNQIGEKLHLDSGTLTPLLKRLENKGFIARKRRSCDERMVDITTTEKGLALKEEVAKVPPKVVEAMGISPEELAELKEIVERILHKKKQN
ncbi:MAG: MarR family winged helix-turn-helix transcriptional regulator [Mangrovibacterium sp.]